MTAAAGPHGDVDAAGGGIARQRRRDADELLAHVRQRQAAKRNAAGAAAKAALASAGSDAAGAAGQPQALRAAQLHNLAVAPLSLADLLVPPPALGPAHTAALAAWLRAAPGGAACPLAGPVSNAVCSLLAADGRGDLDALPWGACAELRVFAMAECRLRSAGDQAAGLDGHDDVDGVDGGAGAVAGTLVVSGVATVAAATMVRHAAPLVSVEVHRATTARAPAARPAEAAGGGGSRSSTYIAVVRASPGFGGLAAAVAAHPETLRAAASLLVAALNAAA